MHKTPTRPSGRCQRSRTPRAPAPRSSPKLHILTAKGSRTTRTKPRPQIGQSCCNGIGLHRTRTMWEVRFKKKFCKSSGRKFRALQVTYSLFGRRHVGARCTEPHTFDYMMLSNHILDKYLTSHSLTSLQTASTRIPIQISDRGLSRHHQRGAASQSICSLSLQLWPSEPNNYHSSGFAPVVDSSLAISTTTQPQERRLS